MMKQDDQSLDNNNSKQEAIDLKHHQAASYLVDIIRGKGIPERPLRLVRKCGVKLDNYTMNELLTRLKYNAKFSYKKLLQVYMGLDRAVEEGILDEEFIDKMQDNPGVLEQFIKE